MEEVEKKKFQLKLTGTGMNIDQSVDQATALAVIQIVMGGFVSPAGQAKPATPFTAGVIPPRTSLRSYIDQVGAKNIATQIVAIAAFLRDAEGKGEFTREEIGDRFKNAGVAPPTNLARDFRSAVANGWIAEDPKAPGNFFIASDGDAALQGKFSDARHSTGRQKRKKKVDDKAKSGAGKS